MDIRVESFINSMDHAVVCHSGVWGHHDVCKVVLTDTTHTFKIYA